MGSVLPLLAAIAAASSVPHGASDGASSARRSDAGASSAARVTVRIIHGSAAVGHGRPAPLGAVPRVAVLQAADNSPVTALIYDFE